MRTRAALLVLALALATGCGSTVQVTTNGVPLDQGTGLGEPSAAPPAGELTGGTATPCYSHGWAGP